MVNVFDQSFPRNAIGTGGRLTKTPKSVSQKNDLIRGILSLVLYRRLGYDDGQKKNDQKKTSFKEDLFSKKQEIDLK